MKKSRIFGLLTIFCALIAVLILVNPTEAQAATVDSGTCGDNLTWILDDAGTLTISGTGAMWNWTFDASAPWYSRSSAVKKVVIGNSVTTIGNYAFYWCTSLTSVTIPDSVTTIGGCAFEGCTGLTVLTIPDSVTTIGNSAFECCYGLTSVTIGNSVTTIGNYAFCYCNGLTSVTIPDSVTTIGNSAFRYCYGLTSVTIPNSVTIIGEWAFSYCTGLTGIWVEPNNQNYSSDTKGVLFNKDKTTLVQAPGKLSGAYEIPDSVTTIGSSAFSSCTGLTSVTIGNSVTTIGTEAFSFCTGLTSVTIPNSVTSIGSYAFYGCTGLTSVTIPDSVTSIGSYAFDYCTKLTHVAYTGTQSQWSAISIGQDNEHLTGATRHYEISFQCIDNCMELSVYCPVCEKYIIKTVKAGGAHSFEAVVTAPTCTQAGSTTKTCTACGEVQSTAIAATGHSGTWIDLIPVSCSEDGLRARACTVCGTMETQSVPAFGHSYTSVVTAPTCTQQGYTTTTCSACGNVEVTNYVSAKGHSWNPWLTVKAATCAAEGTQMRFCNCGTTESKTIEKLPHSYENGSCTVCGAAQLNEKFDIDVARMILGNALEFQFGVAMTKIPDTTGFYAVIEKTWADGTTTQKTIPAEEWGKSGSYHAIVYDGLAAKEMGDTFYVTIYNADGVAVSNAKQDAVRDYVERAYASQSAKGKTMMVDMLNYGAAAQTHFNYGTSDLANAKLTDAQKAVATATTPEMSNDVVKGNFYQGTRFILQNRIQVQLAFANMTNDMYAIYTYTDAKGEAKEVRVEGTDFVIIGGKPAGVELSALVYSDARALVNVTLYNADGTVYGSATDSIESCCVRSGGDLFVYLMKFADSAKAHLYG